jgi:hypothetical protein
VIDADAFAMLVADWCLEAHWDLVCDLRQGGRVTVDNQVLIKDGALVL